MTTTLFYFTGSGNSLHITRDLAAELKDSEQEKPELVSIPKAINNGMRMESDCIGFIFPVYCFGVPRIVSRFIDRLGNLPVTDKDKYYFAVCTHGGTPGQTLKQIGAQCETQEMKLSAGFTIQMPVSGVIMYDVEPADKQKKVFRQANKRIVEIADIVKSRKESHGERGSFLGNLVFKLLRSLLANSMYKNHLGFWSDESCNGCGICQAVCPTGNINISNNKPKWGSDCESCLACLNWCPNQAIQYKKKTTEHGRYTNPEIEVHEIFSRELEKK